MLKEYLLNFGFTEKEVKQMLKDYNLSDSMDEVKEWYDGYMFGNTDIYNPWSVANYFNNDCTPKPFWTNTSYGVAFCGKNVEIAL